MTILYPFIVSLNKCGGICSNIDDPYARLYIPNKVKNMNVIVFNLMSERNETIFSVCNSKQKWKHNVCQCECKELGDWDSCKNYYM